MKPTKEDYCPWTNKPIYKYYKLCNKCGRKFGTDKEKGITAGPTCPICSVESRTDSIRRKKGVIVNISKKDEE